MLRKLKRNQEFWERKGPEYPYHVPGVKISVIRPENYTACHHISIPTGNRERLWGFKTETDRFAFIRFYKQEETKIDITRRLSDALLKIRPLGGSEMFIRVGETYYADPDYCGKLIDELRKENHELKLKNVRKNC